jgi:glycerol-3-phosphate dehydrogenase
MIPSLETWHAARLFQCYGTRCERLLEGTRSLEQLGEDFGHGLTAREVDYLMRDEWAKSAEDILWRRTKLGLKFSPEQSARLEAYVSGRNAKTYRQARYGSASSG